MHDYVLKMFEFLKNMVKFFGILLILFSLLFILYWIQNLTGINWAWTNFSQGFFNILLEFAESLTPEALNNLNFIFEVKYIIVILFFIFVYKINDYLYDFVVKNEEIYLELRKKARKFQENLLNKNLEKAQTSEQEKIKKFVIYVSTSINDRKNFVKEVVLEEQNKIMNKFLIEKTGVLPEVFESGFLYKFNDFSLIDEKLNIFFKLLKSSAPLDYFIVLHSYQNSFENELLDIKNLISLKLKNKISMNSKTAYRYSFIKEKKYKTSQIGMFQKGDETVEVMYFEENNL